MTARSSAPQVTLSHGGQLQGRWEGGLRVFRGIRYAQAPYGPRRFQAPEPEVCWQGMREAGSGLPAAPQTERASHVADVPMLGAEDCLGLNVWAPQAAPGDGLPVMVWIHGGGFLRGSASEPLYDGASFARRGVVFVAVQYRLGIDGFMQFEDAPANRGLLDQIAALRWVRNHIAAWGGDPRRVTVFGQSAGAGALACLLGMPSARGLFQRVILQSPSVDCQSLDEAAAVRCAVAHRVGVPPTSAGLAAAPLPDVVRAVHQLAAKPALRAQYGLNGRNFFPLRPVVDGRALPAAPLQAIRRAWQEAPAALEVMVGSNAEEMRLYHVPDGAIERIGAEQLKAFLHAAGLPHAMLDVYRRDLFTKHDSAGELLCAVQSDFYYRVPAQRIASLASRSGLRVHAYEFTWSSPRCNGRLGAAHAVELPFVFGNLRAARGIEFTGHGPPSGLSNAMHGAWVRFAKGEAQHDWPAYSDTAPWVMQFDTPAYCTLQAESPRFDAWRDLL